tara:strand:- start:219 stop:473 length:255 start_codon:yes stop_codon:yes gene_type:complete
MDIDKVYNNIDKLDDARLASQNTFSLDTAKACHSLIHNLIEAYKLKDDRGVKWILEELAVAFYFIDNISMDEYSKLKVYKDRMV